MAKADSSFQISAVEPTEKGLLAKVFLNEENDLFEGHFPDNPIMPGVLNVEIIEKILFEAKQVRIKQINQIKFLTPVIPKQDDMLIYHIDIVKKSEERTIASIIGKIEEVIFVKVQLEIEPID